MADTMTLLNALRDQQVKFTDASGKVYYGEVIHPDLTLHPYGEEAAKAAAEGMAFIADALTPKHYKFPAEAVHIIPYGPWKRGDRNGWSNTFDDEYGNYQMKHWLKHKAASEAAAGKVVAGAMFRIQMGDGYAWYVVTEVKGQQCLVEHRKFSEYMDRFFGYGGWFGTRMVAKYVTQHHLLMQRMK